MKKCIILILMLALMGGMSACKTEEESNSENNVSKKITLNAALSDYNLPTELTEEEISNQCRIQNSDSYLVCDGWIYGVNQTGLWKVRTDGNDSTVLDNNNYGYGLQVYGEKLYYWTEGKDGSGAGIYSMNVSGHNKEKILVTYSCDFLIKDDKIYYTKQENEDFNRDENECHLYYCDMDGSNQTKIIEKPVFHFYIFDDCILYQDDLDGSTLHLCKLDGSSDIRINERISYFPIFDGESIYYLAENENPGSMKREVRKISTETLEDAFLTSANDSASLILKGDFLYFIDGDDGKRVHRINKSGTKRSLVTQDYDVLLIEDFGDKILYRTSVFIDGMRYRGKTYYSNCDGSNKRDFEAMFR